MKIALSLHMLSGYIGKPSDASYPNDIQTLLWRVSRCGYEGVEIALDAPEGFAPEVYREALEQNGLTAVSLTGLSYPALQSDDFDGLLRVCETLGVRNVTVDPIPAQADGQELELFIRHLNRVGKILIEGGVRLSYHNHAADFVQVDGMSILERIVAETDERAVFFEPNTYWLQAGGGHVITWLKKLRGRMAAVRFMDYAIDPYSDHTFLECTHKRTAEIGMGNLNWPGILEECAAQGVEWGVVTQDEVRRPPYEAISLSVQNLRAFGA